MDWTRLHYATDELYSNYTHVHNVLIIVCPIHSSYLTYLPTNSTQETNITMTILVSNNTYLSHTIIIVLERHADYIVRLNWTIWPTHTQRMTTEAFKWNASLHNCDIIHHVVSYKCFVEVIIIHLLLIFSIIVQRLLFGFFIGFMYWVTLVFGFVITITLYWVHCVNETMVIYGHFQWIIIIHNEILRSLINSTLFSLLIY